MKYRIEYEDILPMFDSEESGEVSGVGSYLAIEGYSDSIVTARKNFEEANIHARIIRIENVS